MVPIRTETALAATGRAAQGQAEQHDDGNGQQPPGRHVEPREDRGGGQRDDHAHGDRRVVADDEVVPEAQEGAQRTHQCTSMLSAGAGTGRAGPVPRRRIATPSRATSTVKASSTRIAASEPCQCAPAPSAPQKMPKVVSSEPTANFMVFSGSRASGWRTATPAPATTRMAASAPITERPTWCRLAPKATTMNATSRPSSSTPLKDSVKAYQSETAPCSIRSAERATAFSLR